MVELVLVVLSFLVGGLVCATSSQLLMAFGRRRAGRHDDARTSVVPAPGGTMTVTVTNPSAELVVVTAFASPARWPGPWGHRQVRRPWTQEERWAAQSARQLLGTVAAGGQSSWRVIGEASTHPSCRVVLNLFQAGGRVRVHEMVVRTGRGPAPLVPLSRRVLARAGLGTAH